MKKTLNLWFVSLLFLLFTGMSEPVYYEYKPVLMERSQLETSVAVLPAKTLENPGKIYIKNQYLFVVEKYRGIHVIDNTDIKLPVIKHFIRIPGCVDLAIKDNILFADNAVDLISIDISDFANLKVLQRKTWVFPELLPPDDNYMPSAFRIENRPRNTIIVEWIRM